MNAKNPFVIFFFFGCVAAGLINLNGIVSLVWVPSSTALVSFIEMVNGPSTRQPSLPVEGQ